MVDRPDADSSERPDNPVGRASDEGHGQVARAASVEIRGLRIRAGERQLLVDAEASFPGGKITLVVGPSGATTFTVYPDDGLSAADAYGQAPKVPREEAMAAFGDQAVKLLEEVLMSESPVSK